MSVALALGWQWAIPDVAPLLFTGTHLAYWRAVNDSRT